MGLQLCVTRGAQLVLAFHASWCSIAGPDKTSPPASDRAGARQCQPVSSSKQLPAVKPWHSPWSTALQMATHCTLLIFFALAPGPTPSACARLDSDPGRRLCKEECRAKAHPFTFMYSYQHGSHTSLVSAQLTLHSLMHSCRLLRACPVQHLLERRPLLVMQPLPLQCCPPGSVSGAAAWGAGASGAAAGSAASLLLSCCCCCCCCCWGMACAACTASAGDAASAPAVLAAGSVSGAAAWAAGASGAARGSAASMLPSGCCCCWRAACAACTASAGDVASAAAVLPTGSACGTAAWAAGASDAAASVLSSGCCCCCCCWADWLRLWAKAGCPTGCRSAAGFDAAVTEGCISNCASHTVSWAASVQQYRSFPMNGCTSLFQLLVSNSALQSQMESQVLPFKRRCCGAKATGSTSAGAHMLLCRAHASRLSGRRSDLKYGHRRAKRPLSPRDKGELRHLVYLHLYKAVLRAC